MLGVDCMLAVRSPLLAAAHMTAAAAAAAVRMVTFDHTQAAAAAAAAAGHMVPVAAVAVAAAAGWEVAAGRSLDIPLGCSSSTVRDGDSPNLGDERYMRIDNRHQSQRTKENKTFCILVKSWCFAMLLSAL
jgi:hypothetical protein